MAQHDPFAGGGEDHVMFAHDVAAANGAEADVAALACASDTVPPAVAHVLQTDAAPVGCGFAQHQCGA